VGIAIAAPLVMPGKLRENIFTAEDAESAEVIQQGFEQSVPLCVLRVLCGAPLWAMAFELPGGDSDRTQLTIAQLHYDGGGDWYANPSGVPNLLKAIRERTALPVATTPRVVTLDGPELWEVPYLYMTGHGNVHFSDAQVKTLRRYLEAGGFLHADDNYGMDKSFRREIARVFPDHPLVEVPLDHPIYHLVYDFPHGIPKVHEHDGLPAQGFGIFLGNRLVVYYSYQSDLGNGWEDAGVYHDPQPIRELALRMGVNLFVYATTAVP
jgi:Domain of unknown function (DUF4159)